MFPTIMSRPGARAGLAATLAGPALLLAACGDDDVDTTARAADADLTVLAFDTNDFDEDSYTVSAGELTIAYEQEGRARHTLLIEELPRSSCERLANLHNKRGPRGCRHEHRRDRRCLSAHTYLAVVRPLAA
jgi:hypothetical protein